MDAKRFTLEVQEVREIPGYPGVHDQQQFLDFHELQKSFNKIFHQMAQKVKCNIATHNKIHNKKKQKSKLSLDQEFQVKTSKMQQGVKRRFTGIAQ